jgi:PAS domain S-box-containing protein
MDGAGERGARYVAALADHAPDVVLVLDVETMRVLDVNRGDAGAFGYSRAALLALDAFALFPRWWDAAKDLEPGSSVSTLCRHADGREVPVDVRFARARAADDREVLVAAARPARSLAEVERELAETNRYLHAIVENIPDMIFVKAADTHAFKRFNRAGEELLGFTRGELLGKTDHDFYPKEQADFFHDKDDETFRAGKVVDIPVEPIDTKLRGRRYLHTRKIPIYDDQGAPLYLLGISEDITERLEAEAVARELADVVANARDAVVTWKPDGTVVTWSPGAERLYGLAAADAVGRSVERFVPDAEVAGFRAKQRTLLEGGEPGVAEVVRQRADGHEVEIEESLFVLRDAHGKPQRLASIARDLSELARWRRVNAVLSASGAAAHDGERARSPKMQEALRQADLVAADGGATVLLLGETGVGKSWLARRIHQRSPREGKPFFEINCAGLATQLLESELFGHERGAFTGAVALKHGLVETAEGGTLFLDEVGELSLAVQGQLLAFLDTRSFRRVGGTRALTADVRLIAATNVDLKAACENGRFRRDLYYRLSVVPITVPPLRERRDEIPSLAETILADLARRTGRASASLSRGVAAALQRYAWPGNIRELRNALERALILSRGEPIDLDHLPVDIREARAPDLADRSLEALEREQIAEALRDTGGNRTRAAEMLGISRSTLKRRLAEMKKGT